MSFPILPLFPVPSFVRRASLSSLPSEQQLCSSFHLRSSLRLSHLLKLQSAPSIPNHTLKQLITETPVGSSPLYLA